MMTTIIYHVPWVRKHVITAIQCSGTDLPNFANARTHTPRTGRFPYAHEVIYACDSGGHRFEDGDTTTTVTCSAIGWTWNSLVASCGCMFVSCLTMWLSRNRSPLRVQNCSHIL